MLLYALFLFFLLSFTRLYSQVEACRDTLVKYPQVPFEQRLKFLRQAVKCREGKHADWLQRAARACQGLEQGLTKIDVANCMDLLALLSCSTHFQHLFFSAALNKRLQRKQKRDCEDHPGLILDWD